MGKKPTLRVVPADEAHPPKERSVHADYHGREALIEQFGLESVERSEAAIEGKREAFAEEQQPVYQQLFPGDPERARRLGRIYQTLHDTIWANMVAVEGKDRDEIQAAIEPLLPMLTGRPQRKHVRLEKAPTLWAERDVDVKTNPAKFTIDTYKRWIGQGLTRQHLRELDPQLYHALSVWEHRHPEDRIKDLPTLAEVIDEKIASLANEFEPEELRKLGTTLQTRLRRSKK